MSVKVKLRIKATITDLVLAGKYSASAMNGFFTAENGNVYAIDKLNDMCSDVIEYTAWGEYSEEQGNCVIRYTENPDIGYAGCITTLIFSPENRGALIMTRDGEISTAARFDMKEKRQHCRYETPIIPVEFAINTRSVHNTVDSGSGAILLDYNIEVRGVNTERNRLFIEVQGYDG